LAVEHISAEDADRPVLLVERVELVASARALEKRLEITESSFRWISVSIASSIWRAVRKGEVAWSVTTTSKRTPSRVSTVSTAWRTMALSSAESDASSGGRRNGTSAPYSSATSGEQRSDRCGAHPL
jgi:hypothetical protein